MNASGILPGPRDRLRRSAPDLGRSNSGTANLSRILPSRPAVVCCCARGRAHSGRPRGAARLGVWLCHRAPGGQRAFTMIEIAISLAVIGFALVAIIGILPIGMNVQKENRQETIINQDGNMFMEAIRFGGRGFDDLTNYVVAVTNYWALYSDVGPPVFHTDAHIYDGAWTDNIGNGN